jgi:hypothetical protein
MSLLASISSRVWIGLGITVAVLFFLVGWLFNFIGHMPFHILVERLSNREMRTHICKAAMSTGFGRSSFRHFFQWIDMVLKGQSCVKFGGGVPECRLISIEEESYYKKGSNKRLLTEFLAASKKTNKILILVMGSYT